MTVLQGVRGQVHRDFLFYASGAIVSGGQPQQLLPERKSCSSLLIQNTSAHDMRIKFGAGVLWPHISNGQVSSVDVGDGGFGFRLPPLVTFLGGGANGGDGNMQGNSLPTWPAPLRVAKAHTVLVGGRVQSVVIDDPGEGYVVWPFGLLSNDPDDGQGCATPSANSGILLPANGGTVLYNGTFCPTDPVAIFGTTTGDTYECYWSP